MVFPETFLSGMRRRRPFGKARGGLTTRSCKSFIEESDSHEMVILVGVARAEKEGIYQHGTGHPAKVPCWGV